MNDHGVESGPNTPARAVIRDRRWSTAWVVAFVGGASMILWGLVVATLVFPNV
jgi:hypothetical protein